MNDKGSFSAETYTGTGKSDELIANLDRQVEDEFSPPIIYVDKEDYDPDYGVAEELDFQEETTAKDVGATPIQESLDQESVMRLISDFPALWDSVMSSANTGEQSYLEEVTPGGEAELPTVTELTQRIVEAARNQPYER